jgi:hypothetical protein
MTIESAMNPIDRDRSATAGRQAPATTLLDQLRLWRTNRSRVRQENDIADFITQRGGVLTDDMERQIINRIQGSE